LVDETGGSGTLNDGAVGTSCCNATNQLFYAGNQSIILYFGGPVTVSSISFFGGNDSGNAIPGILDGVTVKIGAMSQSFATTPFGPDMNGYGEPSNDLVVTGSPLDSVAASFLILSGFASSGHGLDGYFSIS